MMRTLILLAAVMLLTWAAQAAAGKLPAKFAGHWCPTSARSSTFTRGRCPDPYNDGQLVLDANGFEGHEEGCKVRGSILRKGGSYQMKLDCGGEGTTWTENTRMSMDNNGRLKVIRGRSLNWQAER